MGEGGSDEDVASSERKKLRLECKNRYPTYDQNGGKMAKNRYPIYDQNG